jgi:hypothetical protein
MFSKCQLAADLEYNLQYEKNNNSKTTNVYLLKIC